MSRAEEASRASCRRSAARAARRPRSFVSSSPAVPAISTAAAEVEEVVRRREVERWRLVRMRTTEEEREVDPFPLPPSSLPRLGKPNPSAFPSFNLPTLPSPPSASLTPSLALCPPPSDPTLSSLSLPTPGVRMTKLPSLPLTSISLSPVMTPLPLVPLSLTSHTLGPPPPSPSPPPFSASRAPTALESYLSLRCVLRSNSER